MREIKFRGVSAATGDMIFGSLVKTKDRYKNSTHDFTNCHISKNDAYVDCYTSRENVIIKSNCEAVIENTVGQYTGLKDKNGVEIYEGDILRSTSHGSISTVEVGFLDGGYVVNSRSIKNVKINSKYVIGYEFEVIGNIHQSPELAK